MVNGIKLVDEFSETPQIIASERKSASIAQLLYLIAGSDILFRSINVHSVGDVRGLLFDGDKEVQSAKIKAYTAVW